MVSIAAATMVLGLETLDSALHNICLGSASILPAVSPLEWALGCSKRSQSPPAVTFAFPKVKGHKQYGGPFSPFKSWFCWSKLRTCSRGMPYSVTFGRLKQIFKCASFVFSKIHRTLSPPQQLTECNKTTQQHFYTVT